MCHNEGSSWSPSTAFSSKTSRVVSKASRTIIHPGQLNKWRLRHKSEKKDFPVVGAVAESAVKDNKHTHKDIIHYITNDRVLNSLAVPTHQTPWISKMPDPDSYDDEVTDIFALYSWIFQYIYLPTHFFISIANYTRNCDYLPFHIHKRTYTLHIPLWAELVWIVECLIFALVNLILLIVSSIIVGSYYKFHRLVPISVHALGVCNLSHLQWICNVSTVNSR